MICGKHWAIKCPVSSQLILYSVVSALYNKVWMIPSLVTVCNENFGLDILCIIVSSSQNILSLFKITVNL